jgi:chemotaxis protein MotA
MSSSTFIGIVIGILAIFGVFIWDGGSTQSLFLIPAMTIVIGGTIAAGLSGSSFAQIKRIPKLIKITFTNHHTDVEEIISQLIVLSAISRRDGVLSLESKLDSLNNPFLRKIIQVIIDGADPQTLISITDSEIMHLSERHNANIGFFTKLGGYSPTMGIIGTVMGLISTLASAGQDPQVLIRHIASAFIATLWGIFMANIVWLPIADRLRNLHNLELQENQVMIDGAFAMASGETPSMILSRLVGYFPLSQQEEIYKRQSEILRNSVIGRD